MFSLHLCGSFSVGEYGIFKQKNKGNITFSEIGRVIEKLDDWDKALVDFSITVPYRFQRLNTKSIADKIHKEGVLIGE